MLIHQALRVRAGSLLLGGRAQTLAHEFRRAEHAVHVVLSLSGPVNGSEEPRVGADGLLQLRAQAEHVSHVHGAVEFAEPPGALQLHSDEHALFGRYDAGQQAPAHVPRPQEVGGNVVPLAELPLAQGLRLLDELGVQRKGLREEPLQGDAPGLALQRHGACRLGIVWMPLTLSGAAPPAAAGTLPASPVD